MSVKRIEAIVDAIAFLNNMHDPSSDAYKLRNPLLARAYSYKNIEHTDEQGRRQFSSYIGGYRFAVQDIEWKCSGNTRAKGSDGSKLRSESPLKDLLLSLRQGREENLFLAIEFIQKALQNEDVSLDTPLSFFLETG